MADDAAGAGEWFYGRDCLACGAFIPMFGEHDHPVGFRGPPVMHLDCPHCHHEADYGVVRLKRRRVVPPG